MHEMPEGPGRPGGGETMNAEDKKKLGKMDGDLTDRESWLIARLEAEAQENEWL